MAAAYNITLNDGNIMPGLAFGSGTAWYKQDATAAIVMAIENGITHLDGAQNYGNEESIGAAIKLSGKPRESLFVTTKLDKIEGNQTVRETLVESLKKLQLDYVDLFLVHNPLHHSNLKETWKEFEALKKEGLTRSIGVSNFRAKDLEEIIDGATIIPAVNQIEFHPYLLKTSERLIAVMQKHNIVPTSYGSFTPIAPATDLLKPYLKESEVKDSPVKVVALRICEKVASASGKSVSDNQILELWLKQKGFGIVTTSAKVERIREYVAAFSLPALSSEDVQAIDEAGAKLHHRRFIFPHPQRPDDSFMDSDD